MCLCVIKFTLFTGNSLNITDVIKGEGRDNIIPNTNLGQGYGNRPQCREICRGDICEAGPELLQVVCAHRFA